MKRGPGVRSLAAQVSCVSAEAAGAATPLRSNRYTASRPYAFGP